MEPDDLHPDPIAQFDEWKRAWSPDDDAVVLATSGLDGTPNARVVLVKRATAEGFVFHTNKLSAKGHELRGNSKAALVWHWQPRQVRVAGNVHDLDAAACDAYWHTRPRGSQLGAWASEQSTVIADRAVLEERLREVSARFEGRDVSRPDFWGGYVVVPATIEFWCHRDDRLHDRVRYRRDGVSWLRERLSP